MSHLRRASYTVFIAVIALGSGIAIGFGALWYAFEIDFFGHTHNRLLVVVALSCVFIGALPWRSKRPIPEGLAE